MAGRKKTTKKKAALKKEESVVEEKVIVVVEEATESIGVAVADPILEVQLPGGMILDTEGIYLNGVLLNPTQVFNCLHAWADDNLTSLNATPEEVTEDPMDDIDRVENIED